jgi:hypothetical protein
MKLCQQIFLLIRDAIEPLTVEEISTAVALDCVSNTVNDEDRLLDPADEILKLCSPLITVVNEQAQMIHTSVKDFLQQLDGSRDDSNAFLALKSLSKLSQAEYRLWKLSASLLRKHLLYGHIIPESTLDTYCDSVFYNYACLHWHEHVIALSSPPDAVLTKLRQFLTGNEFVTWSEILFDLKNKSGLDPQVAVRAALKNWYISLPAKTREQIPINAFFVTSHEALRRELTEKADDELLPNLPLVRLGEYFNLGAESREDWQKAYEYKKTVAENYAKILGNRNPITLVARTSLLQEYFWQTRFDEAVKELLEVSTTQYEVLGEEVDYFSTLQLLGLAQFYVNKFDESCSTLEKSQNGLRKLLDSSNPSLLATELYEGYAHEAKGELDQAYALYRDIWSRWAPVMGIEHPLSLMVQCASGSIHRKRKEYDQAQMSILQSYNTRLRLFTIGNNVCVDSAIQLAAVYRDQGCGQQAGELLDSISTSSVFSSDFERACQVQHIRALVGFDAGDYKGPKLLLQRLLHQASGTDRDKNNRELLWIRITLADVLRNHGEDDEASMLFSDLVEPDKDDDTDDEGIDNTAPPSPSSLDGEPEPPSQLAIAEKALRFVKDANQEKARNLLKEHRLRWVRKRDFWIMQGGPITDTGSMVTVRLSQVPD